MLNDLRRNAILVALLLFLATSRSAQTQQPQKINSLDLGKVQDMLREAYSEVKKNYYDPQYHGIDIEARYREYSARLNAATSLNDGMRVVAAYLDGFKDSHLFFIPPMRPYAIDSGFRMQMVGDQCLITEVRPNTDAAEKLQPGDKVVSFNTYPLTRDAMWKLEYFFNILSPQGGYELNVQGPDGAMRHVSVKSSFRQRARTVDLTDPGQDYWELIRQEENEENASRSVLKTEGEVSYWKMPEFNMEIDEVESFFARARKHGTLVLDLRGNPGGYTRTLQLMVGSVFDHDVKIADRVGRKDSKPMMAKKFGTPFTGKLIVLIDARSASSAELFARTIQLEHRGTVIGDNSSGSVMEARHYSETTGGNTVTMYAFSVTEANLVMGDGKSLESTGVTPDEVILPTQKDVAAHLDPVLSRAASLAGGSMTPADAGKMFPFEWLPLK